MMKLLRHSQYACDYIIPSSPRGLSVERREFHPAEVRALRLRNGGHVSNVPVHDAEAVASEQRTHAHHCAALAARHLHRLRLVQLVLPCGRTVLAAQPLFVVYHQRAEREVNARHLLSSEQQKLIRHAFVRRAADSNTNVVKYS